MTRDIHLPTILVRNISSTNCTQKMTTQKLTSDDTAVQRRSIRFAAYICASLSTLEVTPERESRYLPFKMVLSMSGIPAVPNPVKNRAATIYQKLGACLVDGSAYE